MKEDQEFLKSIFAGDNTAFQKFYAECRSLFLASLHKQYPYTTVSLEDLYQDSVMELWSQIIDGKLTEDRLTRSLASYIIGIGINKLKEESRRIKKDSKLKKGEPIFKKHRTPIEEIDEDTEDSRAFPLQSKKQQTELKRDTAINDILYRFQRKVQIDLDDDTDESTELLREWSDFLQLKYEELGYPCNKLLKDTWYNNMTDDEILQDFSEYANTNVIKSKRYKCHKALLNMFNAWRSTL